MRKLTIAMHVHAIATMNIHNNINKRPYIVIKYLYFTFLQMFYLSDEMFELSSNSMDKLLIC